METKIIELKETTVIGIEGLCTEEKNIVQDLWQKANSNFKEVAPLAKKNNDGTFVGFWGAMTDETRSYKPWTNNFSRGLYLAGVETNDDANAPEGWSKWVIPARKYLVVDVEQGKYGEIFNDTIKNYIPNNGMKLVGAVCDFTDPLTGKNKLYFPIETL